MVTSRMQTTPMTSKALWYVAPGKVELRDDTLPEPGDKQVRIEMSYSAISRGTERLVFNGSVPSSEWERMRAPFQDGDFPFPVKYGYSATGIVRAGHKELIGRRVFTLHPHQDQFVVPAETVVPIPNDIPSRRATLAANMETALNAIWDSGAGPGDRITVIGAGVVGLLTAYLAARLPAAEVTVIDPQSQRQPICEAFGTTYVDTPLNEGGSDIVFHTSATAEGLASAITVAEREATIVEMSWYGDKEISVALGGRFHSQRLKLFASQVGDVAPSHRARWSHARRLTTALELLADDALDILVSEEINFLDTPIALPAQFNSDTPTLPPVIRFSPNGAPADVQR